MRSIYNIVHHNTGDRFPYHHKQRTGAGVFVLTMFCGLPVSSLLCGILAAPDPRKLWMLPAMPSVLYFLLFPYLAEGYLPYRLAQFAGLVIGYAAFAITIDILQKIRNRKQ